MFAPQAEVDNPAKQGRGLWANAFQQIEQDTIDNLNRACGVTENTIRLQPDALQSESDSAVLLSADQHYVTVHDPKEIPNEYKPGRERPLPKDEFADLWSLSSNRVQLFLVRDLA